MSDNRNRFDDNGLYDDDKTRVFKPVNKTEKDFFDDDELVDIEETKDFSQDLNSRSRENKESYNDGFDMDSQPKENYSPRENRNYTKSTPVNNHNNNVAKGKKGNNGKKSNTPMIISIVATVIALILIVVLVIVFTKGCKTDEGNTSTSTTEATTTMNGVVTETTEYVTYREDTSQETTEVTTTTEETTTEETTQPPTELPNLVDASFLPYKCITPDGDRITSDFTDELGGEASINLASDGSYTLAVGSIANCSGTYSIDGNYLMMDSGYSGTVSFDDAGNPVAVIVSVDGYQVYFN